MSEPRDASTARTRESTTNRYDDSPAAGAAGAVAGSLAPSRGTKQTAAPPSGGDAEPAAKRSEVPAPAVSTPATSDLSPSSAAFKRVLGLAPAEFRATIAAWSPLKRAQARLLRRRLQNKVASSRKRQKTRAIKQLAQELRQETGQAQHAQPEGTPPGRLVPASILRLELEEFQQAIAAWDTEQQQEARTQRRQLQNREAARTLRRRRRIQASQAGPDSDPGDTRARPREPSVTVEPEAGPAAGDTGEA